MDSLPLVSVCMVSYNQEEYVGEALKGVLMQRVAFPLEVIVSDDCSTDMTSSVLKTFETEYPNIVKPIFGSKNIGYPNNLRRALESAQGKYVALCDCDDYWTDPDKLQKQVDYLESHPDCAICFHNVLNVIENHDEESLMNPEDFPLDLTIEDMITRKWFLPTNSEVFRRENLSFPDWYDSVLHVDYVLNLIMAQFGYLHYMPDVMAVYRHTPQSVSTQHADGAWGYMLFHSKTMKQILCNMRNVLDPQYHSLLDCRVGYYQAEIEKYEREVYFENHLLARLFRPKTYKRKLKRILGK